MELASIVVLVLTGVIVGLAQGLLGVGGAFIMVPVMVVVFNGMDIPTVTHSHFQLNRSPLEGGSLVESRYRAWMCWCGGGGAGGHTDLTVSRRGHSEDYLWSSGYAWGHQHDRLEAFGG